MNFFYFDPQTSLLHNPIQNPSSNKKRIPLSPLSTALGALNLTSPALSARSPLTPYVATPMPSPPVSFYPTPYFVPSPALDAYWPDNSSFFAPPTLENKVNPYWYQYVLHDTPTPAIQHFAHAQTQTTFSPEVSPLASPTASALSDYPSLELESDGSWNDLTFPENLAITPTIDELTAFSENFDFMINQAEVGGVISSDINPWSTPTTQPEVYECQEYFPYGSPELYTSLESPLPTEGLIQSPELEWSMISQPQTCSLMDLYSGYNADGKANQQQCIPYTETYPFIEMSDYQTDESTASNGFEDTFDSHEEPLVFEEDDYEEVNNESPIMSYSSCYDDSDDCFSDFGDSRVRKTKRNSEMPYIPSVVENFNNASIQRRSHKNNIVDSTVDLTNKWVCKEKGCNKYYKGRSGLRYHREHAHGLVGSIPMHLIPACALNPSNSGNSTTKKPAGIIKKRMSKPKVIERSASNSSFLSSPDEFEAESVLRVDTSRVVTSLSSDEESPRPKTPSPRSPATLNVVAKDDESLKGKWVCCITGCKKSYNGRSGLRYHRQTIHKLFGTVPNTLYIPYE
ncbi:hypothetical protein HK098_008138 [Nowakowskiella sp. JEL0407]|nr:hypothetical protein HK098_008138 [Nowakowskiella sp. JEL0407]